MRHARASCTCRILTQTYLRLHYQSEMLASAEFVRRSRSIRARCLPHRDAATGEAVRVALPRGNEVN